MAHIKCPECGQNIGDDLSHCPNCGFQLKSRKWLILSVNVLLIIIAIGLVFCLLKPIQSKNKRQLINYEKNAVEYITNLSSDCTIIETVLDSQVKKVFYYKDTSRGVELRCYDLETTEEKQLATQDHITTITNFKYDKNNNCIFLIAKTTNENISNRYCLIYIDVNNCKTETIAYGIAIYFVNKDKIAIEKIFGWDEEIDIRKGLAEILEYKDLYINDQFYGE